MTELGNLGTKLDGALSSLTGMMGGNGKEGMGGLFQKLDQFVNDNSGKISTALTNINQITAKLNDGQGTLGKLINDPTLHDQLLAAVGDLKIGGQPGARLHGQRQLDRRAGQIRAGTARHAPVRPADRGQSQDQRAEHPRAFRTSWRAGRAPWAS